MPYAPALHETKTYRVTPITPKPTPSTAQIVHEIARVFEPEGKAVVVKAINCFYSESGLRADAYNPRNKNGTNDAGVAQINSIWKMSLEERFDYRMNIRKAYEIYKRSGSFNPWYGALCGK